MWTCVHRPSEKVKGKPDEALREGVAAMLGVKPSQLKIVEGPPPAPLLPEQEEQLDRLLGVYWEVQLQVLKTVLSGAIDDERLPEVLAEMHSIVLGAGLRLMTEERPLVSAYLRRFRQQLQTAVARYTA